MSYATKFPRQAVADACRNLGATVGPLPSNIEGWQLLWAISGNESGFGDNCTPRHEPAYDAGGRYAEQSHQAALLRLFGPAGACSYGPMQVMLVNAPTGYTPDSFNNCELAMRAGVFALNTLLLRFRPQTVAEIGYCYNGGHKDNPNDAARSYGARLAARYVSTSCPAQTVAGA